MPSDADDAVGACQRFCLLATAIAGKALRVGVSTNGTAYTDGVTIFIPPVENEDAIRSIAIQASLLAAGSLDRHFVGRIAGHRPAIPRYLTLEVSRATRSLEQLLPRSFRSAVLLWRPAVVPQNPEESLGRALGTEPVPAPAEWFGTIRPRSLLDHTASPEGGSPTPDDEEGRLRVVALPERGDDEDSEELKAFKVMSSPLGGPNVVFRFFQNHFGLGRRPGEGPGGADLPVGGVRAVERAGGRARRARPAARLAGIRPPTIRPDAIYPEWNTFTRTYRRNWCHVIEFDPSGNAAEAGLEAIRDRALERQLARLHRGLEQHRRQDDGEGLDIDALVDLAAWRAAGQGEDGRVYTARLPSAPDLAVLILLDQRSLVANLAGGLDHLGYRAAVYGFNSQGPTHVRMIRIKTFDERLREESRRRLRALEPMGYTRMGAAIRHAVMLLSRQSGVARRVLLMVSDGFPYDEGYEGRYAEDDTRRALSEANRQGVAYACLNLSRGDDSRLERVFGAGLHERLDHPGALAPSVRPLLTNALAAVQRTGAQGAIPP
jgi:nitric oxide reductase NorD protein